MLPSAPLACLRSAAAGVELDVLVQPPSSRSQLAGLHDGRLKVRLAAPPVDGAANEALVDLLAEMVGVPNSSVEVVRGSASRRKTILIRGTTTQAAEVAIAGGVS